MKRSSAALALTLALAGCQTTIEQPDSSNLAAYCTPQNAERAGAAGRAYFGVCPKESESAFLAALERGRELASGPPLWPIYEDMRQTESMLVSATSEAERERLRTRLRELELWARKILFRLR